MDDRINVFIDTNILIDYLARRKTFFEAVALIIQLGKKKKCNLQVSSLSFATASFIMQAHYKMRHDDIVKRFANFVKLCNVTTVDSQAIDESLTSLFDDFEDAMQYFSATREGADVIITRNKTDFNASQLPIYEPQEFLDVLLSGHQ